MRNSIAALLFLACSSGVAGQEEESGEDCREAGRQVVSLNQLARFGFDIEASTTWHGGHQHYLHDRLAADDGSNRLVSHPFGLYRGEMDDETIEYVVDNEPSLPPRADAGSR